MIYPVVHIERDESLTRIETGIVQFGNDWPGVFIRGDNALGFAMALKNMHIFDRDGFIDIDPIQNIQVKELTHLLLTASSTTA